LPEMQPGALNENDLVQDIIDEYNTPHIAPLRPQGIQPAGGADVFHHVQPNQPINNMPMVKPMQEDWQTYLMREGKFPLLVGILYFVISLEFVDEQLMKYIPKLFNNSCEITMSGVLFKAALLSVSILLIKHFL
ncbi:unnamed protein product, partial [marine sediment metagenome]